jgi:hypothetical protein
MERTIASQELTRADVVVVPDITSLNSTNFDLRNYAIIEGEKAGFAAVLIGNPRDRKAILIRPTHKRKDHHCWWPFV